MFIVCTFVDIPTYIVEFVYNIMVKLIKTSKALKLFRQTNKLVAILYYNPGEEGKAVANADDLIRINENVIVYSAGGRQDIIVYRVHPKGIVKSKPDKVRKKSEWSKFVKSKMSVEMGKTGNDHGKAMQNIGKMWKNSSKNPKYLKSLSDRGMAILTPKKVTRNTKNLTKHRTEKAAIAKAMHLSKKNNKIYQVVHLSNGLWSYYEVKNKTKTKVKPKVKTMSKPKKTFSNFKQSKNITPKQAKFLLKHGDKKSKKVAKKILKPKKINQGQVIVAFIRKQGNSTAPLIASATGIKIANIRWWLSKLKREGTLSSKGKGIYELA